jgi:superfamily II DNA or RNA helicase
MTIKIAKSVATGIKKTARHYQQTSMLEVAKYITEGFTKICVVQDTGTGKTFTAKLIAESNEIRIALNLPLDKKLKVLWIAHRETLVSQAKEELEGLNNNNPLIEFIPQLTTRDIPEDLEFDIVIHDEAHHEPTTTFQRMLPRLCNVVQIGLTAETDREDMRLLKYQKIVAPMTRIDAEEEGWILRPDLHTIINPSTDMVSSVQRLNIHYPELFPRTVVFLQRVDYGLKMIEYFSKQINPLTNELYRVCNGVTLTSKELINELKDFSSEKYDIIITVNKLGEGVDLKNVHGVVIARNVNSRTLLNQMVGRAVRTDVSICRVVEFVHPLRNNLTVTEVVGEVNTHYLYNYNQGKYSKLPYKKLR